jgi:hypothetical protein
MTKLVTLLEGVTLSLATVGGTIVLFTGTASAQSLGGLLDGSTKTLGGTIGSAVGQTVGEAAGQKVGKSVGQEQAGKDIGGSVGKNGGREVGQSIDKPHK